MSKCSVNRCVKRAFTLVELLTVVAVIGVLVALLLPSLSKARDRGRIASCANSEYQISLAIAMYADENNSYGPTTWSPGIHNGHPHYAWDDHLGDYDGRNLTAAERTANLLRPSDGYEAGIYLCAGDNVVRLYGSDPDCLPNSYSIPRLTITGGGNYSNNERGMAGVNFSGSVPVPVSLHIGSTPDPARAISLLERWLSSKNLGRYWQSNASASEVAGAVTSLGHHGVLGANYLLLDGHVEWLTFYQTLSTFDGSSATVGDTRGSMWDTLPE